MHGACHTDGLPDLSLSPSSAAIMSHILQLMTPQREPRDSHSLEGRSWDSNPGSLPNLRVFPLPQGLQKFLEFRGGRGKQVPQSDEEEPQRELSGDWSLTRWPCLPPFWV